MFDEKIVDLKGYNASMQKSLMDKAFFLDKVDATVFIDFGCADGALIEYMRKLFPKNIYIGYDISLTELELARTRLGKDVFLTQNWDDAIDMARQSGGKIAVICNSLIHEVYAYGDLAGVEEFWNFVFDPDVDYVVIRDMCLSQSANRPADPLTVAKVRRNTDIPMLQEFEALWGSIDDNQHLTHYLLKYRYTKNWAREVVENYLPLTYEYFIRQFPKNYQLEFAEHYTLPFLKKQLAKDFNIDLQERTHAKFILAKTAT